MRADVRRTPFRATWPLNSDAMDTANAHNDTVDDEATDLLEQEPTTDGDATQGPTTDGDATDLLEQEPATGDDPEQPAEPSSAPPVAGWAQRLTTPAEIGRAHV